MLLKKTAGGRGGRARRARGVRSQVMPWPEERHRRMPSVLTAQRRDGVEAQRGTACGLPARPPRPWLQRGQRTLGKEHQHIGQPRGPRACLARPPASRPPCGTLPPSCHPASRPPACPPARTCGPHASGRRVSLLCLLVGLSARAARRRRAESRRTKPAGCVCGAAQRQEQPWPQQHVVAC